MKENNNRVMIRPMTEEDLLQVETIEQESFSLPWSFDAFKSTLDREDTLYLVAEEESVILGYCGMYISFDEGEIPNVAVKKEFRSRGIGEAMMNELLSRAGERGVCSAFLEVRKSNEAAKRLYEKLGFEEAGIRKNFYEFPKEDAVIMWKR
jgi:ribosomal-protein-alanine N-acetyltransferase